MSVDMRRIRSLLLGGVVGGGLGVAIGVVIGVGLAALADAWFPAVLLLVAAVFVFELWRLRQKPRPSDDDERAAGGRRRLPLLLFGACVVGGGLGFAIAAAQGGVDASAIAVLGGLVIGAALPTLVDLSRARRGL